MKTNRGNLDLDIYKNFQLKLTALYPSTATAISLLKEYRHLSYFYNEGNVNHSVNYFTDFTSILKYI